MFLQRTELLIGSDNIEKLKNSNVIVFGLGGVLVPFIGIKVIDLLVSLFI